LQIFLKSKLYLQPDVSMLWTSFTILKIYSLM